MLPGFYMPFRGRKRRSAQQIFADKISSLKRKSFKQIGEIFGSFIPNKYLKLEPSWGMSRRSIFSKENTFWAFLENNWGRTTFYWSHAGDKPGDAYRTGNQLWGSLQRKVA